ncbi:MAG: hypothetical protein ACOCQX_04720 [Candidatus Nanoarchaeia archaeon]
MAFDKSLDKQLFEDSVEFEGTTIKVGVYSYNEGPKKLQIIRKNVNAQGEPSFAKLGRMNKEEVEAVIPLMQKALEYME